MKVFLAQSSPSAQNLVMAYQVSAGKAYATFNSVTVTNLSNVATTFRVCIRQPGTDITSAQFIFYDTPLCANETINSLMGIMIPGGDSAGYSIWVYSDSGQVAFNISLTELP